MKKYILVTEKEWHDELFANLKLSVQGEWMLIRDKVSFTAENLDAFSPDMLFIPHWSHIIPESVYGKYECILFHMTDLPYGRGGSPLQNLIIRGFEKTVISAIRVEKGIDTGPLYGKKELSLDGTAAQIFKRASGIIEEMIIQIIKDERSPKSQEGEVVIFKRRKREDGNLSKLSELKDVYNYIRMLDCEGYPNAFIETDKFIFEFTNAILQPGQSIDAHVRITKK